MLEVGILGASGYVGLELLRLLLGHPDVQVKQITSDQFAEKEASAIFPHLLPECDLVFAPHKEDPTFQNCEVWFISLPHKVSMEYVPSMLQKGKTVIDLSADYRLENPDTYQTWYGHTHSSPQLLGESVYGLTEWNREKIRSAKLVACPGCYPTGAILALGPAIEKGLLDAGTIVVNSLSGVTGAGRKAEYAYNFVEINENAYAYGAPSHRHTPEIEQEIGRIGGKTVHVTFIPHLIPVNRGIYTTVTAALSKDVSLEQIKEAFGSKYSDEPFIQLTNDSGFPNLREVRGSNNCRISVSLDPRTNQIVIVSVLDNLMKGAAGQAVQNFNIMMGFPEETGLINRWGY